jgi:NAD+ kinase
MVQRQRPRLDRIAFVSSQSEEAEAARHRLQALYGHVSEEEAEVIVALGGDGLMLQTLHKFMNTGKPIYGIHRGTVGFLMNEYQPEHMLEQMSVARISAIHPLVMKAVDAAGKGMEARAFNEVSLWRQTFQAAKLRVSVDGIQRLDELSCDGIIVATPAGSTAYNLSAHGPIIPLGAPLLAVTPISPFRPRHWRGALVPDHVQIHIEVLEAAKRPVSASADHNEIRDCVEVVVRQDWESESLIMFNLEHSWEDRILAEQFRY